MKLHGYLRGSGRLGNIVCARVGRETIAKTHNPYKTNPNTEAQVNERSRFKLITQLAASYAPVIAIPKEGNQSKRNRFVRRNYEILHAEGGQASIDLTQIQLTQGVFYIPGLSVQLSPSDGKLSVKLEEGERARVSRIVYIVFQILDNGKLILKASKVVEDSGTDGDYATEINVGSIEGIVYAYGIQDKDTQTTAIYKSWQVLSAEKIAQLVVRRAIEPTYFRFSKTTAAMFIAEEQPEEPEVDVTDEIKTIYVYRQSGSEYYRNFAGGRRTIKFDSNAIFQIDIEGLTQENIVTFEASGGTATNKEGTFVWNDIAKRLRATPIQGYWKGTIILHVEGGTDITITTTD